MMTLWLWKEMYDGRPITLSLNSADNGTNNSGEGAEKDQKAWKSCLRGFNGREKLICLYRGSTIELKSADADAKTKHYENARTSQSHANKRIYPSQLTNIVPYRTVPLCAQHRRKHCDDVEQGGQAAIFR